MVTNCPMLYGKLSSMIDIEMLAAIMKELGYLDEDDKDADLKSDTEESSDKPDEKPENDRPAKS